MKKKKAEQSEESEEALFDKIEKDSKHRKSALMKILENTLKKLF